MTCRVTPRPLSTAFVAVLLALLFAAVLPTRAQDDIRGQVAVPEGEWTVGDVIPLEIQVRHPAGSRVIIPPLEGAWGAFEVRRQGVPTIRDNNDGTETTIQPIDVALFAPGDHITPELSVSVVGANGVVTPFVVPASTVTLRSVLTGDDTTLRDIKPQWALDAPNLMPILLGGLAAAGVLTVLTIRAVRGSLARRASVDNRTPHQRAYDNLIDLEASGLLAEANYKDHYAVVAATLRQLVEDIYNFPATETTTAELRRALRGLTMTEEQAQYLLALLQECDVVKFADVWPEGADARSIAARARQWIVMIDPSMTVARGVRSEYVA